MDHYITGATIKRLRETLNMTQAELAERISVSDKTISKWETGKGLPDITLIESLAAALKISVIELLRGASVSNRNRACNMKRSKFYVCPICGNVVHAAGETVISCCGITLPALEADAPDADHPMKIDYTDGKYCATLAHPMTKEHSISFIAYLTDSVCDLRKLYPEGDAEARFYARGRGEIYAYCNHHGLIKSPIKHPR